MVAGAEWGPQRPVPRRLCPVGMRARLDTTHHSLQILVIFRKSSRFFHCFGSDFGLSGKFVELLLQWVAILGLEELT